MIMTLNFSNQVEPHRFASNRLAWLRGGAIVGLAILTGCVESPTPEEPTPLIIVDEDAPPPRTVITQAQFDKILYDTNFGDVVEFLGMDPSRQESTYDEGVEGYTSPSLISWYIWDNPDGSFIKLGFTGKRLTDKTSESLAKN